MSARFKVQCAIAMWVTSEYQLNYRVHMKVKNEVHSN